MSTLFNLRPPVKEKEITHHPWERTIKDVHSNAIKYAHNSIKNPHYPEQKKKLPDADITKFTVIGDRVTEEFIYCVNLVNGLHKYRWKKFDVPEIRGLTSIEWPEVWRSLKVKYGGLAHCLQSRVAVLMNGNFLGGKDELKELIENKYIYHLQLDYYNEAISNFATYIRSSGRPCAYMHISINKEPIGTMIFMLYSDLCPYTSDNFLRLCHETKGGYSGTPIHRIVKDGWIQCGGFGLKNTDLDCENFLVPHDRRGVLCMANNGRHCECSTQFFVLLQPAPWMADKYVAFGQLIEGENTLNKIEEQPTWYESPTNEIIITQAGILNMECHDITINKGTHEYLHGHVENLFALGDIIWETLIERVFLEAELRLVQRLERELLGEEEELGEEIGTEGGDNIRRTRRFIRKGQSQDTRVSVAQAESQAIRSQSIKSATTTPKVVAAPTTPKVVAAPTKDEEHENNDFDVEEYELEESVYQHMSIVTESLVVPPEKPYYIPLTDVPYPGEKDSTFDLKKFLKGDYCLESDLASKEEKVFKAQEEYPSAIFKTLYDVSEPASLESLDSIEEKEIRDYLRTNADRVSFAGGIVKGIARGYARSNLLDASRNNFRWEQITEEQLRRVRVTSADYRSNAQQNVKVKIETPDDHSHHKIKRRQTGFVPRSFVKTESEQAMEEEDIDVEREVRMTASAMAQTMHKQKKPPPRRPTGFVRMMDVQDSDSDSETEVKGHRESHRTSALQRLYDETRIDDYEPTLKSERSRPDGNKLTLLKYSTHSYMKSDESELNRATLRKPKDTLDELYVNALELQHNKKLLRKISSDYVKTFNQTDKFDNSIRSIEYAKTRPALTVSAYQLKNQMYQEEMKKQRERKAYQSIAPQPDSRRGTRSFGDSPCYELVCSPTPISEPSLQSYEGAYYPE